MRYVFGLLMGKSYVKECMRDKLWEIGANRSNANGMFRDKRMFTDNAIKNKKIVRNSSMLMSARDTIYGTEGRKGTMAV